MSVFSIDDALRFWARDRGDQVAIRVSDAVVDYTALEAWVARCAARLAARGVEAGDRVAFYAETSLEFCVGVLATIRCGAIAAPINSKMVAAEVDYLLGQYEPVAIVADAEGAVRLAAAGLGADRLVMREEIARWRDDPAGDLHRAEDPDAPCAIITTSGSTARPKGVVYSQRSIVEYALEEASHNAPDLIGEPMRLLTTSPLSTAGGCNLMLHAVATGASVFLLERFEPAAALAMLASERLNTFRAAPVFFQRIAELAAFADADLSNLKVCSIGGAAPPPGLLEIWWAKGVVLRQLYGQTEAGGGICVNPIRFARSDRDRCGHGGPYTRIAIVDAQGNRVPANTQGQIIARKPGIMLGYWRDPAATAEALRDGWLFTGDIGEIDERGLLQMVDRMKDVIRSGGMTISSAELERVIMAADGVAEVAILSVPDAAFGEAPFAIVHGTGCTIDSIVAHCRANLSSFKVPRYVVLWADPLPRLAMGKISKPALRQVWADRPLPPPVR